MFFCEDLSSEQWKCGIHRTAGRQLRHGRSGLQRSAEMLYIERNHKGEIIAIQRDADKPGMESKQSVDDEILEFLGHEKTHDSILRILSAMDAGAIRILEDLIDLLVNKNIIMFTELPKDAQIKIQERRQIRQRIGKETIIVDDII
jgi:hypothetical protein